MAWQFLCELCQWLENHTELRRLVITNLDFKPKNLKKLKSALVKSLAPLVEIDLQ